MRGGFLGNLVLVLITIGLLAVIFGLFFNIDLLGMIMSWVSLGIAAIIDFFTGIINAIV